MVWLRKRRRKEQPITPAYYARLSGGHKVIWPGHLPKNKMKRDFQYLRGSDGMAQRAEPAGGVLAQEIIHRSDAGLLQHIGAVT